MLWYRLDLFHTLVSASTHRSSPPHILGTAFFQGQIDEVKLFDQALSDAEVRAIYDATNN